MMISEESLKPTPQVEMLTQCIRLIRQGGKLSDLEAFDKLMEYMSSKLRIDFELVYSMPQIVIDTLDGGLLDWGLLHSDPWDWLGEVYVSLGLNTSSEFFLSKEDATAIAQALATNIVPRKDRLPVTILDPEMGSGRILLKLYNTMNKRGVYFGTDTNLRAYRMALVTIKLYDIPAFLLKADSAVDDVSLTSPYWSQANVWYPRDIKKLKKESA